LATALVYNPIMKIEFRTTPKYPDLSQPGDDVLVVLPQCLYAALVFRPAIGERWLETPQSGARTRPQWPTLPGFRPS
jgi:hypothetical protein